MAKKGLLIVSFGTSFQDALSRDIVPVEETLKKAFPDYAPYRAFGSNMIIKKLKNRDGICIDTIPEALGRMVSDGVTELLIQPTYLIHGIEYDRLVAAVREAADQFQSVKIGRPLLSVTEDYISLCTFLAKTFPKENGTLILMGHGTEHYANSAYAALQTVFMKEGHSHVLVGAVEGYPDIDSICKEVLPGLAVLTPLMLVAGDHATNDMASNEPDSWKSKLAEVGVVSQCVLRGLGSYAFVQDMLVEHAKEAAAF